MLRRMVRLTVAAMLAAAAVTAGIAVAATSSHSASLPTVKLMVGGIDKQIYLPYQLAQGLGFYKKYGVDVQLSTEQNGGVGAEDAMASGAVDMAGATHFILGLNDRKADGTDVSWIWDVDFEQLAGKAQVVVPAGTRAHDLAVRLKYAGVESRPPQTEPGRALDDLISVTPEGATAHILCTYTAMLDIRAELVRRGWAKPYWET